MLELPLSRTAIKLADWLELWALMSRDNNASAADLVRTLQREQEERDDNERADRLAQEAMTEIGFRVAAAGDAYPFSVDGNLIRVHEPAFERPHLAYTFCLCLSYFGFTPRRGGPTNPRRWFEELSEQAARAYVGGESLLLSPPRRVLPGPFPAAIAELCRRIGEGGGWRQQPAGWNRKGAGLAPKDDAVDVIAWRPFPDGLAGNLLLFGQCASGNNWDTKLTELQPQFFAQLWMVEVPPSQALRALFIPHRISRETWNYSNTYGGIVFDRCRIATYIQRADTRLPNEAEIRTWCRQTLQQNARPRAAA
jgi:hypothetical protein